LTSTAWPDGGEVPQKHAGGAMGISPALTWTNVPAGTVEFVLIMNDPEPVTPRGSATGDILHWLVAKIPATTTSLPEGAGSAGGQLPAGARQIRTYAALVLVPAGPQHHYTLTLYALSAPLEWAEKCRTGQRYGRDGRKGLARGIFGGDTSNPEVARGSVRTMGEKGMELESPAVEIQKTKKFENLIGRAAWEVVVNLAFDFWIFHC
jgi:Raf kinase inhibitor-like YbhB/YbcL family protein